MQVLEVLGEMALAILQACKNHVLPDQENVDPSAFAPVLHEPPSPSDRPLSSCPGASPAVGLKATAFAAPGETPLPQHPQA